MFLKGTFLFLMATTTLLAQNLVFNYTPEQIDSLCDSEKQGLLATIDAIGKLPTAEVNLENSVLRLEKATAEFNNTLTSAMFMKYVSSDEKLRAAADRCEKSVQQMMVDIYVREDLYKAIKASKDNTPKIGKEEKLLVEEYLVGFKRNGLELDPEKRKIYVEKKKELVFLESEFNNNLAKETGFLEVTKEELDGLSPSYIEGLEKTAEGKFKITLDYPHYFPFMENAKNADARKRLEFKFNRRGGDANKDLLERAIRLRDELATMLGFPTHAAFVLDRRMAKTPEAATKFLSDLTAKLLPKGKENLEELSKLKVEHTGSSADPSIRSWDWRYYDNLLKKTKYQVNSDTIREYFPIETVLKGMFEIYQTLLGVEFKEEVGASVWHSAVKKYSVVRKGKPVAYFFMDMFPREGKYGHAAAFTIVSGYRKPDGSYETPASSIVANFNAPSAEAPSLLDHAEVETLFHEFGHIMHQILTTATYATFSGTNVKTDFVEAPSQMLENWVWDESALKRLSGHYKNPNEKLPTELIQKMLGLKLVNVGVRYLRQLSFATLDLQYHTQKNVDTTAIYAKAMKDILLIPIQDGTIPQASFGHLMGGYDSGYYGYLWSEVYAQDMFTRFEVEGLLNPVTGQDYAKWILEPGGATDPFQLITAFLGREPNNAAFLKSIGL